MKFGYGLQFEAPPNWSPEEYQSPFPRVMPFHTAIPEVKNVYAGVY